MDNKNFTNQQHKHAQSKQDSQWSQGQGFVDGYTQAVLDFKAILQEQEGKGYKTLKDHPVSYTHLTLPTTPYV